MKESSMKFHWPGLLVKAFWSLLTPSDQRPTQAFGVAVVTVLRAHTRERELLDFLFCSQECRLPTILSLSTASWTPITGTMNAYNLDPTDIWTWGGDVAQSYSLSQGKGSVPKGA